MGDATREIAPDRPENHRGAPGASESAEFPELGVFHPSRHLGIDGLHSLDENCGNPPPSHGIVTSHHDQPLGCNPGFPCCRRAQPPAYIEIGDRACGGVLGEHRESDTGEPEPRVPDEPCHPSWFDTKRLDFVVPVLASILEPLPAGSPADMQTGTGEHVSPQIPQRAHQCRVMHTPPRHSPSAGCPLPAAAGVPHPGPASCRGSPNVSNICSMSSENFEHLTSARFVDFWRQLPLRIGPQATR